MDLSLSFAAPVSTPWVGIIILATHRTAAPPGQCGFLRHGTVRRRQAIARSMAYLSDLLARGDLWLRLKCDACNRRGSYDVRRLMRERGDANLPDLLVELSSTCPKRQNPLNMTDRRQWCMSDL